MHLVRVLATAAAVVATMALAPVAMATNTPDQPASLHLVRGGGGHFGGFAAHGRGGFHSGYAWRGGARYRPWHGNYRRGVYPYAYGCPYPYSYPYCTWPNG